ncbi:MAG: hypothetical protein GX574_05405 [Lentisphaerae bacterium]|nr:hypothetical protein [Lentisphaerota bacterium]OQC13693.1 MAG: hypothetical protein BWX73_02202 [Lentisphaerae bacterium ADurb.Bin082]HQL86891.1 hypothetical protein [Lentisphaeria bacterium]
MSKASKNSTSTFFFDGRLTPAIRRKLQEKRRQIGLPYQLIAKFFGVNWSTFRKWELGPTEVCELSVRPRLEAFMKGEYDVQLRGLVEARVCRNYGSLVPQEVLLCLERVSNAYRLCHERPDLRDSMVKNIDQATIEAMSKLISPAGSRPAPGDGQP